MSMKRNIVISILQAVGLLLGLTSNLVAVEPLDIWQWRNPLPQGNQLNAITCVNELVVAVGEGGTIVTSTNLEMAWWSRSPLGTNVQTFNAIAYANSTFVVGGSGGGNPGTILTSTDGTNWYKQTWTNSSSRAIYGLAYGAGLFVAACERGEIWSSPDGTSWTRQTAPVTGSSRNLRAITYRPDVGFVAVGDTYNSIGEIATSPDGINWVIQTVGVPAYSLYGITWGVYTNGDLSLTTNFLTVGSSGALATSPDGTNWTSQSSGTVNRLRNVAYGPGVGFIAAGDGAVIQWSTDGTNWTSGWSDLSQPGNAVYGATYAMTNFMIVGATGMTQTSPTGVGGTWVARHSGKTDDLTAGTGDAGNLVVVGTAARIFTSPDGVSWTLRSPGTASSLRCVAKGGGTVVAAGDAGALVSSSNDGTNWFAQTSGVGTTLNGLGYGAGTFVAMGASGVILTSPDGTNWTSQTSPVASTLRGAAYNAGLFVIVGDVGIVLTSPDGTTWSQQYPGLSTALNGITYAGGLFVTAGASGKILTSSDGTNWTSQTSGSSGTLNAIAYGDGNFVVAGNSGVTLTSPDGTNWTTRLPGTGNSLRGATYGAGVFVMAGTAGTILQASALTPQIVLSYVGGVLTLTWSGGGTLQTAPDVAGPYTNVPGAVSPYSLPSLTDPSQLFFRVRLP
jgi:hypothetical protein